MENDRTGKQQILKELGFLLSKTSVGEVRFWYRPETECVDIMIKGTKTAQVSVARESTFKSVFSVVDALNGLNIDQSSCIPKDFGVEKLLSGIKDNQKPRRKTHDIMRDPPRNDIEFIEQIYMQEWAALYQLGKVAYKKPFINYAKCGALIKNILDNGVKQEDLAAAVTDGFKDEFVQQSGYALTTILSASVINRLLNPQTKNSGGKDAMSAGWDRV